ncbi:MAG: TonB-dependent receptor, partial [Gammaproteobacteria bacterium]|nr:TonB-dependent receptor [Gammaproteobacteria bacterium]
MKTIAAVMALALIQTTAMAAEPADAGPLPNMVVIESNTAEPAMSPLTLPDNSHALGIDGAEIIRSIAGVSAGRFGGHGLEPVVRGQSQGRLNVILDGAYVHGGCPNRMDPPTSFMGPGSYDRVTVLKGVQTLLHGAGGSGGTVLFERQLNPPADGFDGNAGVSTSSNGVDNAVFADATVGGKTLFARVMASRQDAGNYEDGNGREVRSAYTTTSGTLALGYAPAADSRVELTLESVRTDDALFPGAGMDAPQDKANLVRLRVETPLSATVRARADAWYSGVDHLMDNYSARVRTAPMAMRVPSDSDTVGGRVLFDMPLTGAWSMTAGLDFQQNRRTAIRYQGMHESSVVAVNSYLWPDATIRQTGLIGEALYDDRGPRRIRLGARIDHVSATADAARLDPPGMLLAAADLYAAYYGAAADKQQEDNLSLLARLDHNIGNGLTWFAGASRTVRTADTTERYLASNNPMDPAARWIGNPWLDPEIHHQLDTGLSMTGDGWSASSVVYIDDVSDYILRDRARAQDGVQLDDGATVYRNVDARFFGAELSGGLI